MHEPLSINVEHHYTLIRHITIKEKVIEVKGTYKYSMKSLSTHFLSRIFLPYWLTYQRRFGWRHTNVLLSTLVHFVGFSPTETTPFTASSICYDEELNYWFFTSSVWRYLWGTLIILFQWQKSSSKYEMEVEIGSQPDVVQQQQIQALLANVEELTHQNEELRKTMES